MVAFLCINTTSFDDIKNILSSFSCMRVYSHAGMNLATTEVNL